MFYIFFAFLFSFMLCANESVGDGDIEEITQRKTLRVLYIDDSVVNLKMTKRQVKLYNAQNASSQIELFTRSHGNHLKRSELETIDMVWCDIQMSPYLRGDMVLANIREQHPDFEHPPFIAVTSEPEYHDSDEELSQHARDHHFIAGRDKIKNTDDIRVVLGVYYSWLEKRKEKTYISVVEEENKKDEERTIQQRLDEEWILSDLGDLDEVPNRRRRYDISESEEKSDDDSSSSEHLSEKQAPDPSQIPNAPKKTNWLGTQKVSPCETVLSHEQDETELSCVRKCLERLGNRITKWLRQTELY